MADTIRQQESHMKYKNKTIRKHCMSLSIFKYKVTKVACYPIGSEMEVPPQKQLSMVLKFKPPYIRQWEAEFIYRGDTFRQNRGWKNAT